MTKVNELNINFKSLKSFFFQRHRRSCCCYKGEPLGVTLLSVYTAVKKEKERKKMSLYDVVTGLVFIVVVLDKFGAVRCFISVFFSMLNIDCRANTKQASRVSVLSPFTVTSSGRGHCSCFCFV